MWGAWEDSEENSPKMMCHKYLVPRPIWIWDGQLQMKTHSSGKSGRESAAFLTKAQWFWSNFSRNIFAMMYLPDGWSCSMCGSHPLPTCLGTKKHQGVDLHKEPSWKIYPVVLNLGCRTGLLARRYYWNICPNDLLLKFPFCWLHPCLLGKPHVGCLMLFISKL